MTAAKDPKSAPVSFKSASLDQLWSCLQRCLLFEEPSSRWTKLISQVARQVNGKSKDISQLPLAEQQQCLNAVFGTPEEILDLSSRCFNLVLAMQDLRRFEAADFDIWFLSQSNDTVPHECEPIFMELAEKVLDSPATMAQAAILAQAWNVVPYWRVLESFGPWANDPLAEFVGSLLRKFDRMKLELSIESALSCETEFEKILLIAREKLPNSFQPALLVLVEGITETILLPKFLELSASSRTRQDSNSARTTDPAAMFLACGGANQLLRKYLHLQDVTRLPILCVVDHDAVDQIKTIADVKRDIDHLHVWSVGEIEDTFTREILLDSLNHYLQTLGASDLLMAKDLAGYHRTELLNKLWRNRGLGDFDKVGFAQFHVARIKHINDVPGEGRMLMDTIKKMILGKHAG